MKKKKIIWIIGDYDCDGIMASSILKLTFETLGYKVTVRLPKRFSEGYGLSEKIVQEIPKNAVIITVDNGIAAASAIKLAKEKGCYVLLTDHHLAPINNKKEPVYPDADMIIDPKAIPNSCDFTDFCGATIAFKLAKALLGKDHSLIPALESLAGIATIADVMPLIRENRQIVLRTLNTLMTRKSTLGINLLLDILEMQYITETDIGYQIGPIINASGRMMDDGASFILEIVSCNDIKKQNWLMSAIEQAIQTNDDRKVIQKNCLTRVLDHIKQKQMQQDFPLCVYEDNVPEGIIGILAGRLAELYKTPCLVFSNTENETISKGSARSYNDVHLKKMLDEHADLFSKYGGHAGAAGMSIPTKKIDILRNVLKETIIKQGYKQDFNNYYDIEMSAKYIPIVLQKLLPYAPFGEHNAPIIFKIKDFTLDGTKGFYEYLGDENQHLKLYGQNGINALHFNTNIVIDKKNIALTWEIYGELSYNYYNGVFSPQIIMLGGYPKKQQTSSGLLLSLNEKGKNRY